MIVGLVRLSDCFASLGIGWGWSKWPHSHGCVGVGCWNFIWGYWSRVMGLLMWAATCDHLDFCRAIIQHQFYHFYWSNQKASSDWNEGNKHCLSEKMASLQDGIQGGRYYFSQRWSGWLTDCFNLLACNLPFGLPPQFPEISILWLSQKHHASYHILWMQH